MDRETREFLQAMEGRMLAQMDVMTARMDRLEGMEPRLIALINDNQQRLLERMRQFELTLSSLIESSRGVTTALGAMSALLTAIAGNQTDIGRRVTDLEKR